MIHIVQDKQNADFQGQVWGRDRLHNSATEGRPKTSERCWTAHHRLAAEDPGRMWLDEGGQGGGV